MKQTIYAFAILAVLVSCEKDLEKKLDTGVTVTSETGYFVDDTLYVTPASEVVFHFTGDPDFITFYSGESGNMYDRKDMTQLPPESLTSKFACTFRCQYGQHPALNTFHVYLTTEFPGLSGEDKEADLRLLNETVDWIDISEKCNIPSGRYDTTYGEQGISTVEVPLDEYLEYPAIYIAFLYTVQEDANRPRWEVQNFRVLSTDLDTGTESVLMASDIGFNVFHEDQDGAAVYNATTSNSADGRWRLNELTSEANNYRMGVHSSNAGSPLYRSWAISNAIDMRTYTPDLGVAIKTITNYVDSYTYTYSTPNLYKATFVMKRANYRHSAEQVRDVYVRVVEEDQATE